MTSHDLQAAIHEAIATPAAIVPRRDLEPLVAWQTRAVLDVLEQHATPVPEATALLARARQRIRALCGPIGHTTGTNGGW